MLAKKYRLIHKSSFDLLFRKGRGVSNPLFRLKFVKNGKAVTRIAVVVGVKVSKSAVVRNRVRRRLQASFRILLPQIRPGFDLVALVQPGAKEATFAELDTLLHRDIKLAGLLVPPSAPSSV